VRCKGDDSIFIVLFAKKLIIAILRVSSFTSFFSVSLYFFFGVTKFHSVAHNFLFKSIRRRCRRQLVVLYDNTNCLM